MKKLFTIILALLLCSCSLFNDNSPRTLPWLSTCSFTASGTLTWLDEQFSCEIIRSGQNNIICTIKSDNIPNKIELKLLDGAFTVSLDELSLTLPQNSPSALSSLPSAIEQALGKLSACAYTESEQYVEIVSEDGYGVRLNNGLDSVMQIKMPSGIIEFDSFELIKESNEA